MDKLTSIIELAEQLGVRKQTIFKILTRLEIEPKKLRDVLKKNQFVSYVTKDDVEKISRECQRITKRSVESDRELGDQDDDLGSPEVGFFYLIQLEPDHDPGRIKVGFTSNISGRLQKHRCSAPFAKVIRSWPCRRTWERAAVDCMTIQSDQLHTEVFRLTSIDDAVGLAEAFFKIMPKIKASG